MLAAERRRAILRALDEGGGAVRVADLASRLRVSEMTVRRDLDAMDADELLRKVHGGAVSRHHRGEEPGSSVKAAQQRAEKAAIAELAASTIDDGVTIALSAGTTTTELARRLRRRPSITVVTNSLSVFDVLTGRTADTADDGTEGPTVHLCGGTRTDGCPGGSGRRDGDRVVPGRRHLCGRPRHRSGRRAHLTQHR
ncbi:DeoR/GlpR family DNA-binding transcription regulator [Mycolicibacterium smegmatis]|uniref:DeoR-family transcriptional regulator n=1 Tax=Mycolicibacterium smegmatis (strain ATCC 700084 / mc(2)155) TaxID=246196 RepID=I7GA88_MYCS2|nr:DeoR/GlpR family DNA-binding transcription regulator [Mycolicibacterium smegmatis]AFP40066.1 DeoR-family transcriptional regulator [Mycolicibacterium smegmatis MC2 155]UUR93572.1 DeoR/GlpR family DNA-binding transcription regulator [Mycolicibacterium smegmatis]UUS00127.1 DeoR/GlpR family DNA-binding transcription regulator [Mycolicibacterium smegmatis]UUS06683.1 DeoR/GlpR family DNA-binding transcription regulator [Mycolicibacterium smegmatis]UUS16508.1 DeoR/GlpR family DNA-binding transcri